MFEHDQKRVFPRLTRRHWLLGWAATIACGRAGPVQARDDETDNTETRAIQARALKTGLGSFLASKSDHYLAIGNAPTVFRSRAVELCQGLARDYLKHFNDRGFAVERPKHRLTIVVLGDRKDFAAFLGVDPGMAVGGIYDLDTNRLLVFDTRSTGAVRAERANTVSLLHEATHQLTFNTGLLNPQGDIPLAISEGLAMYGEVRTPDGKTKIGAENLERLKVLKQAQRDGQAFIPVADLLASDKLFEDPQRQQLAYAQSWSLISYLMKADDRRTKFHALVDAIRPRMNAEKRLADTRAALGDLTELDREWTRYLKPLLRR